MSELVTLTFILASSLVDVSERAGLRFLGFFPSTAWNYHICHVYWSCPLFFARRTSCVLRQSRLRSPQPDTEVFVCFCS